MHQFTRLSIAALLAVVLNACASLAQTIEQPQVSLVSVAIKELGLVRQTYGLTLQVENPNGIPLPIRGLNYAVKLAGVEFAEGATSNAFTVPAYGQENFEISIQTDLVSTATHFKNLFKERPTELDYEVGGEIEIDLPLMRPIPFSRDGKVNLNLDWN